MIKKESADTNTRLSLKISQGSHHNPRAFIHDQTSNYLYSLIMSENYLIFLQNGTSEWKNKDLSSAARKEKGNWPLIK